MQLLLIGEIFVDLNGIVPDAEHNCMQLRQLLLVSLKAAYIFRCPFIEILVIEIECYPLATVVFQAYGLTFLIVEREAGRWGAY